MPTLSSWPGRVKMNECECDMCKISILMAVYNSEKTLRRAMDSAIGQTLKDIEIICVDDSSTDTSWEILNLYEQMDPRVKLIKKQRNEGILAARKTGIKAAKGKYIIFLDPDDTLDVLACEILCERMERTGADILQFRARVLPGREELTKGQIAAVQKKLQVPKRPPQGKQIFWTHYCTNQYWHVLWNKAYRAELCKLAVSEVADRYIVLCDDLYLFGLISYFAKKYAVIKSQISLYNYYYGYGISSKKEIKIDDFKMICSSAGAIDEMKAFLTRKGQENKYQIYSERNELALLRTACQTWARQLDIYAQVQGFDILVSSWPKELVVMTLREEEKILRSELLRGIQHSEAVRPRASEKIETLGIYYPQIGNGGVERAVVLQIRQWAQKYRIVLFTDLESSEEEYPLPGGVERIILPPKNSAQRYRYLQAATVKFDIDLFLYEAWLERNLFWDVLAVKLCSVPCVIVAHSPVLYWKEWFTNELDYSECIDSILIADGIVTLSEPDAEYWRRRCMKAKCILNPCDPKLLMLKRSEPKGARLLWVGRISREKHLEDIIKIFELVVTKRPDAELVIVGRGEDTVYNREIEKLLYTAKGKKHIHMVGYTKETYHYYEEASILLLTSEFEGFSFAILEGKAAGVPCVAYDCPNSFFFTEKQGLISVKSGAQKEMAEEIVALLNAPDVLKKLSDEAYASFQAYCMQNIFEKWDCFFAEMLTDGIEMRKNVEIPESVCYAAREFQLQLSEKDLRRALRLVGLRKMYRDSNLRTKIKLIVKLLLIPFGKRPNLHDEAYKVADEMLEKMKRIMGQRSYR